MSADPRMRPVSPDNDQLREDAIPAIKAVVMGDLVTGNFQQLGADGTADRRRQGLRILY